MNGDTKIKNVSRHKVNKDKILMDDAKVTEINFEEELSKFRPSREVEQAEDAIVNMNLKDMTDIMMEILKEKEKK